METYRLCKPHLEQDQIEKHIRRPVVLPGMVARGVRQLASQIDDRQIQNSAYRLTHKVLNLKAQRP